MVFDPGQGPRHSWTGSEGVVCLRALWEMETDPALRAAYAQGLRASAELAAQSLPLCRKFDVNGTEHFEHDWRVMNEAWKPQHSEAETVAVANAGLRVQHAPRRGCIWRKTTCASPAFAAWVVTLCPDDAFVAQHRAGDLRGHRALPLRPALPLAILPGRVGLVSAPSHSVTRPTIAVQLADLKEIGGNVRVHRQLHSSLSWKSSSGA